MSDNVPHRLKQAMQSPERSVASDDKNVKYRSAAELMLLARMSSNPPRSVNVSVKHE